MWVVHTQFLETDERLLLICDMQVIKLDSSQSGGESYFILSLTPQGYFNYSPCLANKLSLTYRLSFCNAQETCPLTGYWYAAEIHNFVHSYLLKSNWYYQWIQNEQILAKKKSLLQFPVLFHWVCLWVSLLMASSFYVSFKGESQAFFERRDYYNAASVRPQHHISIFWSHGLA